MILSSSPGPAQWKWDFWFYPLKRDKLGMQHQPGSSQPSPQKIYSFVSLTTCSTTERLGCPKSLISDCDLNTCNHRGPFVALSKELYQLVNVLTCCEHSCCIRGPLWPPRWTSRWAKGSHSATGGSISPAKCSILLSHRFLQSYGRVKPTQQA